MPTGARQPLQTWCGLLAPVLTCDACGGRIERSGEAVFETDAERKRTGRYWTLHDRSECELADPNTWRLPWQDLDVFLYDPLRNAWFDWHGVEERRREGRDLGLNN